MKIIKRKLKKLKTFKRLKKTATFELMKEIKLDNYISKNIKKNEYSKLKNKKMNYKLDKSGKLTNNTKEIIINKIFKKQVGYEIDFENPTTFNEKINWMKIYYQNPLITKCCDKFALKDYVAEVIGEEYVVPVIDSWTNPDHIDFDKLPDQFAIKVNWASGYLKIVKDKNKEDLEKIRRQLKRWMKPYRNGYYQTFNWGYKDMPPIAFAEKYMEQVDGQLYDYKFFCFNGKPELLFVATDRFNKESSLSYDFYDKDFNYLDITYGKGVHNTEKIDKPKNFEKMKELAEKLAQPFPFVRVDFYEIGDQIYVGEMTFYSGGALLKFEPKEWDYKLGDMLQLPAPTIQDRDLYYHPFEPKECFLMEDKITRKMQVQYCIQKAYAQMGYFPDLKNPKSFNEKVIWLALNYKNKDIKIAADKHTAKEYISKKLGKEYVVPLIGAYEDVNDIDFNKLPEKFVCKANDGWGNNEVIIINNKNTCCWDYQKVIMSTWLYPWSSYYYQNMCITDEKVETKVIIEELIETEGNLDDYKFYCCNGKPKFALVVSDRNEKIQTRTYVDMKWNPLPIYRKGKKVASEAKKPKNLEKMIEICEKLAKDFPLVRIDLYEVNDKVLVGEMTFTPGMFLGFRPIEMDYILGKELDISDLVKKHNNK